MKITLEQYGHTFGNPKSTPLAFRSQTQTLGCQNTNHVMSKLNNKQWLNYVQMSKHIFLEFILVLYVLRAYKFICQKQTPSKSFIFKFEREPLIFLVASAKLDGQGQKRPKSLFKFILFLLLFELCLDHNIFASSKKERSKSQN